MERRGRQPARATDSRRSPTGEIRDKPMISAIVLVTDDNVDIDRTRERAVRSLVWLVSAVVGGVVRDVTAACPPSWPVEDVMDHAGCTLIREAREDARLSAAAGIVRCDRVLVLRMGFQPEGPLVAEVDATERRLGPSDAAQLLAAPSGLVERLFPDRAAVVGVMTARATVVAAPTFTRLVRSARGGIRLRTRMVPVV